jgi:acetyl esterase/lipase
MLDPDLATAAVALGPRPDESSVPDEEYAALREKAHAYFGLHAVSAGPAIVETDHMVDATGMPLRMYRPAGLRGVAPVLMWIHGGGFTLGMIAADDVRCRRYAASANCVVASVEYRLAPEHPYPAAPDDCWAAFLWLAANARVLEIDASRMAIGGASAGGGLAAAMCLRARDHGSPRPVFQMLIYPELDDRMDTTSSRTMIDVPVIGRAGIADSWRRYLRAVGNEVPADAAPARSANLRKLPPTFVMTAEHDPLRDEGNVYALRLQAEGVPTELHQVPGTFHGFEAIGIDAPVVERALVEQAGVLSRALHHPLVG